MRLDALITLLMIGGMIMGELALLWLGGLIVRVTARKIRKTISS